MPDGKKELRAFMRDRRKRVGADERVGYSRSLCRRILERADVKAAIAEKRTFAVYLASPTEIDLSALIDELFAAGCKVASPAWSEKKDRYELLCLVPGGALVQGPHGILEPCRKEAERVMSDEVAVWIVPGLAFTVAGNRLGYGGGWYDRLLSSSSPNAVSLGVAYPFQMVDVLPSEAHDIRLSGIVVV